jgi:HTH-type transcriptional regulator/antitoxin HigA
MRMSLKYKVITSEKQYNRYCKILEELVFSDSKSRRIKDEIDLLTLLIETWDEKHRKTPKIDPVQFLYSLMEEHALRPKHLSNILNVSKGYVSDILHYKKGFSKETIRILADYFKVSQEAFNREYELKRVVIH